MIPSDEIPAITLLPSPAAAPVPTAPTSPHSKKALDRPRFGHAVVTLRPRFGLASLVAYPSAIPASCPTGCPPAAV
jgi:hypothetical protein